MAKHALVIVESPTKAKTIRKFLPQTFSVEASMGHVRDLPQSSADIPEKFKKEDWAKIGVNIAKDFEPLYVVPKGKTKVITGLKRKLAGADELYLATDEDREGESISWHLLELLKPKVPVKRMVFHEITRDAIDHALKDVRDVDLRLVRAQETRRILDRLVGYTLSPLIWKKIAYGLSAGRVQSAGLRLIVQRERERMAFQGATYWDIAADLKKDSVFKSRLVSVGGARVASGKDFDETTGKLKPGKDVRVLGQGDVEELAGKLRSATWKVVSVEEKTFNQRPSPPFITSTLQQEANRKLGLSAREAMRIAQRLYEEGLITYMRTDSPNLSSEALGGARDAVVSLYGKDYLSPEPRQFASKAKGAQEAHEAIRPAGGRFTHPKQAGLSGKDQALYEMIWMRTVATQMAEARKLSMSVRIDCRLASRLETNVAGAGIAGFSATGTRILFPGFLRAYAEGSDDPEAALEEKEVVLPPLKEGDVVTLEKLEPLSHETKPPARFTEASLVQMLEKEGVGRPSTYASIIDTIVDRGYVRKVGNALVPTFTGFAVIQLLEKHFQQLVDLGFTSKMEQSLDEIAEGSLEWLPYLREFFLGSTGLQEQVKKEEKLIDPEASRTLDIFHLDGVKVKIGRFGAYLVKESGKKGDDHVHASIPEDIAPSELSSEKTKELIDASEKGPQSLGKHPSTGEEVYCLTGRFGPYVQLGEVTDEKPKPKRSSLLKGMEPKALTLDQAVQLLSLPRELGIHPQTLKPIVANQGRFGPYVLHDGDYRSIRKDDNLFTIDLKRALELFAEEKKGRRGAAKPHRELGAHPEDGKPVNIYDGKYGMYVKHGATNATIPSDIKPGALTMPQAVELLQERSKKKRGRRK
ncbi:MAG: type I DNA topoisomerase [Deltaproteobacteria bacterium]|nr:type I DNA topoisomerase [Deltaproteobacteria bacterium]